MNRFTKTFVFFKIYLFYSNIRVHFHLVSFAREHLVILKYFYSCALTKATRRKQTNTS